MIERGHDAFDVPDRVPERAHFGPVLVSKSPTVDRRRSGVPDEDRSGVPTIPRAGNLEGDRDVRRRCAGGAERERERRNPDQAADVDSMLHDRSPHAPEEFRPASHRTANRLIRDHDSEGSPKMGIFMMSECGCRRSKNGRTTRCRAVRRLFSYCHAAVGSPSGRKGSPRIRSARVCRSIISFHWKTSI